MSEESYVWVARVSRLGKFGKRTRFYIKVPEAYGEALYGLEVSVTVKPVRRLRQRGI
jgi:hypothetical protein